MEGREIFPEVRIHYGVEYGVYGDEIIYLNTYIRKKFGKYYYLFHLYRSYRSDNLSNIIKLFTKECYSAIILTKLSRIKTIDGRQLFIKDSNQESEEERLIQKYYE